MKMQRLLVGSIATADVGIFLLTTAAAAPVTLFSTGSPDGKIATLSRPPGVGLNATFSLSGTVVPEPSSAVLLGVALGALVWRWRADSQP